MPLFALRFGTTVSWPPFIACAVAGCLMQNKDKSASVPKLVLDSVFEQKNEIVKAMEEELEKAMSAYGFEIV
ncbi:hypothetical protein RGQ29_018634 [Quercus rubra]|uniref:Uncharacterized protein n=1 Tax=Quercus rubra TaxID=3512 RepID=A0AAN7FPE8_QUERU|nr:hypothetical protein RGQ29_018634 [Quercus rubra]